MMSWTPYPAPNATGIQDLLSYANVVTDNMFGLLMLITIFAIAFISMKQYPTEKALTASSFMTMLTSYLFYVLGLIGSHIMLIFTVLTVVLGFLLFFKEGK